MIKPNYKDGSIVNLMSTIAKQFGVNTGYSPLKSLPKIKSKNVILIVLDGLGYEYLLKYGKNSKMINSLKGSITSVYPPTTAAAITTFMTGVAPDKHGLTGWFVYLKELGLISAILPFVTRAGDFPLTSKYINIKDVIDVKGITSKFNCKSFIVQFKPIIDSAYTKALKGKSKFISYTNLEGMFKAARKIIKSYGGRKYVYAYWWMFDSICHESGVSSKKTLAHFKQMDAKLAKFVESIKGTDTTLIVTADHGLIDVPLSNMIHMKDHPELHECLTLPLSGDARTAYCYVHPNKTKYFENYIKKNLKYACNFYKSEYFANQGIYGLEKPSRKLLDRIGDYVLVMKEGYRIKDDILNKKGHRHTGNHGGMSKEELLVPLIVYEL